MRADQSSRMPTDSSDENEPLEVPDAESGIKYDVSSDDRTWGILVHATAFVGFAVPFGNIIAPLLIWALKKEDSRFVDENGKQAINFQISWTIWLILAAISVILIFGLLLLPVLMLAWIVLVCIAIVRASNEQVYEYPLTLEILS